MLGMEPAQVVDKLMNYGYNRARFKKCSLFEVLTAV
jgi:hypothetical protein